MTSQLVGSDFTAAAQLPNYVNGRLLTAEDLATSQATLRARDRQLGRAAGHGVVDGLWVTSTATTLTVAPGLGVAPSGDAVSVGASVTLPLTFTAPASGSSASATFSCCTPAAATGGSAVTAGCYLLTARPACQLTGQAPLASTPGSTAPAGCTAQWQIEGVQFKAIALPLGNAVLGIPVTDANRRNLLAHWCFGSAALATLGADLFGFSPGYGGLDKLDPADLSSADLPLAVFYWNGQAIGFIDNWSVRRRITAPEPAIAWWSGVVSDRRIADGQARLMQFQNQAAELVASGAAGTVAAATTFPLLPPVGFLPVGLQHISKVFDKLPDAKAKDTKAQEILAKEEDPVLYGLAKLSSKLFSAVVLALASKGPQPGFDVMTFFNTTETLGGILDWDIVDFALCQSWRSTPATAKAAKDAPASMRYYLVLQNLVAQALGTGTALPALYVVFIKKHTWLPDTHLPFGASLSGLSMPG